jgi:hypothetical protein
MRQSLAPKEFILGKIHLHEPILGNQTFENKDQRKGKSRCMHLDLLDVRRELS